jgi:hypothetical protein
MSNNILSFLLLFSSLGGWGLMIHNRLKVHIAFIPIFIFSSITTILFCAGLINIMPLAVNLIYYSGLVLFTAQIYFVFKRKYSLKPLFHPSIIIFVLSLLGMMFYLKGLILTHYDNFSHWGLIVREMVMLGGLPDGSTIVTFQNYPPGSAVFIFYFLEILGNHESYALMAQSFLVIACLMPMFFFSSWRRPIVILLLISASFALLLINWGSFYNLLVDIVLGLAALASIVIAYYYRDDWKMQIIVNTPLLLLILLLKDSGKIFLLFNVILILSFIYTHHFHSKQLSKDKLKIIYKSLLYLVLFPIFINYLWVKYTTKAYQTGYGANKFAVTPSKVTENQKSQEFMENIAPMLWKASSNLDSNNFKALMIVNCIVILIWILIYVYKKQSSKLLIFSFLLSNGFYILYVASLYFMYVYLMPEAEAARIAGFTRYQSTIIIYSLGILMTAVINEWNNHLNRSLASKAAALFLMGSLFIYPFSGNFKVIAEKPETITSTRWHVKTLFSKISSTGAINPRVVYFSPDSKDDRGYLKYMVSYEQLSKNYSITTGINSEEELKTFKESLKKSNYLVVLDSDEEFKDWFSRFIDNEDPVGVYRIHYSKKELTFTKM